MFALVALVILSLAPDKPINLAGPRFDSEEACEKAIDTAQQQLIARFKTLKLDAQVTAVCIPTKQQDI